MTAALSDWLQLSKCICDQLHEGFGGFLVKLY